MVNRRAAVGLVLLAAVMAAGCQPEPSGGEGNQRIDPPTDSTPAPDATEGVDPELAEYYTQTLKWDTCGEGFQCASATVPLDYDDPGGDTLELSILRAPATGDDTLGSLLVNPGGPGASGVEYAQLAGSVVTEQVRERYDIVGFDPRGVGESSPIDCLDDAELDEFLSADGTPDDDDEVAELQELVDDFVAGCQSRSGDLLPHIGTHDVARDVDVLRAALGDEKLNFMGKSYGTFIGAVYADMFPDRVGRLVLDGAIDPTLTGDELALGQARGFERALSAFLSWCVAQDSCAPGDTEAEARAAILGLLEQADAEPLPTSDQNRELTESLAFYGLILPLYLTSAEGYAPLNQALAQALDEGDGTMLLQFADIYLERNSSGEYNGNQNEVIGAVNCLDHPESGTVEDAEASLPKFEKISPIFGPFLAWGGIGCGELAGGDDSATDAPVSPMEPTTAEGAAPILVIGTTNDPATPYEWAESLAGQLSSGVLLTYEAAVHTAYLAGSTCIDEAVDAYLLEGTVPKPGTRCSS